MYILNGALTILENESLVETCTAGSIHHALMLQLIDDLTWLVYLTHWIGGYKFSILGFFLLQLLLSHLLGGESIGPLHLLILGLHHLGLLLILP